MSDRYHRRSIRLQGYDYSAAGAYFVTVCAKNRECLFGEVVEGAMRPNEAGLIAADTWVSLPARFPTVDVDEFVVMPNHVHGIVVITDDTAVGAGLALPSTSANRGAASSAPASGSVVAGAASSAPTSGSVVAGAASSAPLGDVVRAFKSISAINVNRLPGRVGQPVRQRGQ